MAESSAEGRTLAPTARRIEHARRVGQVAISRDLIASLAFASACAAMVVAGRAWAGGLVTYLRAALASAPGAKSASASIDMGLHAAFAVLWLPLGLVLATAVLSGLAQTRGNFATESLRADARRVFPRLGRLLGREGAVNAAGDFCKIAVLVAVGYWSVRPCLPTLAALSGTSAAGVLGAAGALAQRLGMRLAIAMVVLGFADYLWQVARHGGKLRMNSDEARREFKESEGDPEHRAERRRVHRELRMEGAAGDVRGAALVLIAPGLAAAAILYSGDAESVPVLMVRGDGLRARKIESVALAAGVPCFLEPALVRALAGVEEGEALAEALYPSVAKLMVKARTLRIPQGSTIRPAATARLSGSAASEQAG
jgi:flagellar biosynthesis protein FlhB